MRRMPLKDRQQIAVTAALILLFVVPAVIAIALGVATGWFAAFGAHPRRPLWGWLSDTSQKDVHGHTAWVIGPAVIFYFFGVFNAYLLYQLVEFFGGAFRLFHRALTQPLRSTDA